MPGGIQEAAVLGKYSGSSNRRKMGSQREETEFKETQLTSARKLQLQTSDPTQTGQVWIVQEITCETRK